VFGQDFAARNPEVVSAVVISASLDWAALTIAAALVAEEERLRIEGHCQWPRRHAGYLQV
jgi:hypothetical protein